MVKIQARSEVAKTETPTSTAGIHASRYAKDRKEVIRLINDMRACGVATELDLPRIVIVGKLSNCPPSSFSTRPFKLTDHPELVCR